MGPHFVILANLFWPGLCITKVRKGFARGPQRSTNGLQRGCKGSAKGPQGIRKGSAKGPQSKRKGSMKTLGICGTRVSG